MKKIIIITVAIFTFFSARSEEKKVIESKTKEVTVFLNRAEVTREASVKLNPGSNQFVFEGLSRFVDQNTIQVSGQGNFVIMSVSYELNYMKTKAENKEIKRMQDSVELLKDQLEEQQGILRVYTEEESLILSNKNLAGQEKGLDMETLIKASNFFRTRLLELSEKKKKINDKIKDIQESLAKLQNQLNQKNSTNQQPTGQVIVKADAKGTAYGKIELKYVVSNASWAPVYDLRANGSSDKIDMHMKANVVQNTGEDWKNVKITLSTGNPAISGTQPSLNPWYVYIQEPVSYQKRRAYAPKAAAAAETLVYDTEADYSLDKMESESIADYTTVSEGQTTIEYRISIPYSISSGGKPEAVSVQEYDIPVTYEYFAIPKINSSAFLLAKATDWEDFNLLSGNMNLYYEGTYVGKSHLNTNTTEDTLALSFGVDQNVVIERKKIKDLEQKKFIGSNKKESFGYDISVRNKKRKTIQIEIMDQIPITTNKDIVIEDIEHEGGILEKTTGYVSWRLSIPPSNAKKVSLKYTIKYPKDKNISY